MVPKINSPLLSEVLESVGPKIISFTQTLDAISDDIRACEKLLQESGFRIETEVSFDRDDRLTEEKVALMWSGGDDGKTWRIYFSQRNGHWDESEHSWIETGREVRPLIETPVRVRLGAIEPLGRLFREIDSLIPSERIMPPSMPPNLG